MDQPTVSTGRAARKPGPDTERDWAGRSAAVVLGAQLAKAAKAAGHRSIAAELSLPAGTVRGWLRRATANADRTRNELMRLAVELDPAGSALADALAALATAVAAARLR